jgi:Flp pilus assembly protein TadD
MVNKVEAEKYKTVGNNHFKNGNYAAAIEQYKLAIEHDPNNPAYWYVLFVACYI